MAWSESPNNTWLDIVSGWVGLYWTSVLRASCVLSLGNWLSLGDAVPPGSARLRRESIRTMERKGMINTDLHYHTVPPHPGRVSDVSVGHLEETWACFYVLLFPLGWNLTLASASYSLSVLWEAESQKPSSSGGGQQWPGTASH